MTTQLKRPEDRRSPFAQMPRRRNPNVTKDRTTEGLTRATQLADLARMAQAPGDDGIARRQGQRPLRPPPGVLPERRSRAGEIEARKAAAREPDVFSRNPRRR